MIPTSAASSARHAMALELLGDVRCSAPHLHALRFHDLRHTYASMLVEHGAHPKEMAELLGHSSVQVTLDRYSHVMPHLSARLADRMDDAYLGAAPGESAVDEAGTSS
ncbi:MAG TPA: tyrosine-type recombinase/integrase [Acidimicrobiales bacterium]|nr:tyrosine-type recombinase/integrase [Acidimicrobiales bacterium]